MGIDFARLIPVVSDTAQTRPDADCTALLFWIGINAIDALLTGLAMGVGGAEANPILNLFEASIGVTGMMSLKTLMGILIGAVLWERRMFSTLSKLNLAMLGVVVYNMLVITYSL